MNGVRGKRVEITPELIRLHPGEYGKDSVNGDWYGCPPDTELLAGLRNHKVVEHEDGTITVSPSILVSNHTGCWHGYLEQGYWRKV